MMVCSDRGRAKGAPKKRKSQEFEKPRGEKPRRNKNISNGSGRRGGGGGRQEAPRQGALGEKEHQNTVKIGERCTSISEKEGK